MGMIRRGYYTVCIEVHIKVMVILEYKSESCTCIGTSPTKSFPWLRKRSIIFRVQTFQENEEHHF